MSQDQVEFEFLKRLAKNKNKRAFSEVRRYTHRTLQTQMRVINR